MPHPGRMTTQKAKDFKGTMRSLLAELGHYKFRLIAVIVFAVLSTIFNIARPQGPGQRPPLPGHRLGGQAAGHRQH